MCRTLIVMIKFTMMVRTAMTVAYWFFALLLVVYFMTFLISLVFSLGFYLKYQKGAEENYKVSFEKVEEAVKKRESENIPTQSELKSEGSVTNYESMEGENEEEKLYKDIGEISERRGIPLDIEGLRQNLENRIEQQEVRLDYLEGFKSVLELAPIQKMATYLTEYDRTFMHNYMNTLKKKQEQKDKAKTFLYVGLSSFAGMLMLSIVVALLLIERNTYHMKVSIYEKKQT